MENRMGLKGEAQPEADLEDKRLKELETNLLEEVKYWRGAVFGAHAPGSARMLVGDEIGCARTLLERDNMPFTAMNIIIPLEQAEMPYPIFGTKHMLAVHPLTRLEREIAYWGFGSGGVPEGAKLIRFPKKIATASLVITHGGENPDFVIEGDGMRGAMLVRLIDETEYLVYPRMRTVKPTVNTKTYEETIKASVEVVGPVKLGEGNVPEMLETTQKKKISVPYVPKPTIIIE